MEILYKKKGAPMVLLIKNIYLSFKLTNYIDIVLSFKIRNKVEKIKQVL